MLQSLRLAPQAQEQVKLQLETTIRGVLHGEQMVLQTLRLGPEAQEQVKLQVETTIARPPEAQEQAKLQREHQR